MSYGPDIPPAPAAPDPYATASAQTQGDIQSAIANATIGNANVYSPLGSSVFNQIGTIPITDAQGNVIDVPRYENRITLSPEQQALYDQQTALGGQLNTLAGQAIGNVQSVLGTPLNTSTLTPAAVGVVAPNYTQPQFNQFQGQIPTLQQINANGGPGFSAPSIDTNYTRVGAAPGMQMVGNGPQFDPLNTSGPQFLNIQNGPQLQTGYDTGGPVQGQVNFTQVPTEFADAGNITRTVGADDFSEDRRRVEEAIMSRLEPAYQRQRAALEAQLANQGITLGHEAYGRGVDETNRGYNDALMQAILAGGQEQSRMFGMDLSRGQFENAAQQQAYDQAYGRGLFGLNATGMNNASALSAGQFFNQAQGQRYGQNQGLAAFGNAAMQQDYLNNTNAAQLNNQFGQQSFENLVTQNQTNNQLANLGYQNLLAGTGANNQALGQQYANTVAGAQANNQALASVNSNVLQAAQLANQAANNQAQFQLAATGLNNEALMQQYMAGFNTNQYNNTLNQQNYDNQLAHFANQLQAGQFQNTARQQNLQEQMAIQNFPINQISALMGGGQVTLPQFAQFNAPQVPGSTIGNNIYQSANMAQQAWAQQAQMAQSQSNAMLSGLFGLGSAGMFGLARSDRKVKRDIYRIGSHNGLPTYLFKYIDSDEPHYGLMADDVEKVNPAAVAVINGIKHVDYHMALGVN